MSVGFARREPDEEVSTRWTSGQRDDQLASGTLPAPAPPRPLPVSDALAAVLELVKNDPEGRPHAPAAFVFRNAVGERISSVKTAWRAACRRAGISDLRFHDLRHEAASRFVEGGWPLHHVQEMLGHSNLKQTSTYGSAKQVDLVESMRKYDQTRALANLLQTHLPPTNGLFATTRRRPTPTHMCTEIRLARPAGLEPATLGLEGEGTLRQPLALQRVATPATRLCHAWHELTRSLPLAQRACQAAHPTSCSFALLVVHVLPRAHLRPARIATAPAASRSRHGIPLSGFRAGVSNERLHIGEVHPPARSVVAHVPHQFMAMRRW